MSDKINGKSLDKDYFSKSDKKHIRNLYSWVSNLGANSTILDLHCGDGYGSSILADRFTHIDGVDTDENKIRFAFRNFFIFNRTRFFISKPIEFLKSCMDYDITVFFDMQDCLKDTDFQTLLDIVPSPLTILSFSNIHPSSIDSYEHILKEKKIIHEWFYEHEQGIDKIQNKITSYVLMLKSTRNKRQPEDLPLVSIIIPAYNSESTLAETILSAINQSYTKLEIIIIDDGSTDHTKEICEKFNSKIKYYYKSNGGIASAINLGIKKMNGVWFKWLSSDDVLTNDAIEKLIGIATNTGGQIIYSDYDRINEQSIFIDTIKEPLYQNYYEFASKIWIRYIGNASGALIHKSCFEVVGLFDENLRFGEDYDWWQRACLVHGYRFFHLEKPIVKYRIHTKQLTGKIKNKAFENDQKIRKRNKELILNTDPEWWKTLSHYRKIYNRTDFKTKIKRTLRWMLRHMPDNIENKVIKWRVKSISNIQPNL